ncbi:outer membrane transport energization protein ExbD [Faunimonas pinastri]|uniref:Biopolymer transport protein ExbD n=1 Tax=Faunimonas pinastri TaxID=1855383 RepID=A0A1H9PC47_9HYPH|nr:TonB system transport protein ExbD [Faunimonas pinastri]SER45751.1 outer membrane transport energization protein ExbD [Faunimonas pinastri]
MAIQLNEGGGDDLAEAHDINVTPFIDVILVLLIIFMVAAPLATVDVPVELPASNAAPQAKPDQPVFLTLKNDLTLSLGNDPVARTVLQRSLDQATGGDRQKRIFMRADKGVAYGDLMSLMNDLRAAGYLKIALVGLDDASAPEAAPPAASAAPATP